MYNAGKYIEECIQSVLNQTYENWEMIIVDDKSVDNSVDICKKYANQDSRIILLEQKENQGVAIARDLAIKNAKGRYIAFLDSDDLWLPYKLEKQIEFMQENGYAFTYTTYETFYEDNTSMTKIINARKNLTYDGYLKDTIIGCLTVIMDQKQMGKINVCYGELEDVKTWMKYLKKGFTAYSLDINLAKYRVHRGSVSANKIKNAIKYFKCLYCHESLNFFLCIYYEFLYAFHAILKRVK